MVGNTLDYDGQISLEDYRKNSSLNPHQKVRLKLINKLLDNIPNKGTCLDFGCGLGDLTYRIANKFEKIIGVDVTPERVEWAQKEFAPIEFQCCDEAAGLKFDDNSFDVVVSSVVINWVDDPRTYVSNIHRVLNSHGHLLILVKNNNVIRDKFRKMLGKEPLSIPQFSISGMYDLLENSGFEVLKTDCYFDPVRDTPFTLKSIIEEILKVPFRLIKIPRFSNYFAIVAKKSS